MSVKLLLVSLMLWMSGCEAKNTTNEIKSKTPISKYVDFKRFSEGRPCSDVTFMCLPESQDKSWQNKPLDDGLDIFELNTRNIQKYDNIVKEWHKKYDAYHTKPHPKGEKKPMLISSLDRDFFDKVDERRFLEEMEQDLEKEFPGFWRDVKKPVRYRWIRRAMNKAKKFGYDPKQNNMMVELCARIGLDFDLDPKWKYITEFIVIKERYIGMACDYIDFTVFNKDKDYAGQAINNWSLRTALGYLPYPKRPIPKLND